MSAAARLDGFQRRHTWLGFPLGVIYKFIDDEGGYLAALITFYGFVSLFPLLLLLVSVLGYALEGNPALREAVLGSALQQLPIVGPQLQQNVGSIHGSSTAVILGVIGAVYGGLGVSVAIQTALNEVWAVPRYARPDPIVSRLRGLLLFGLLGGLVVITTALSAAGPVVASLGYGDSWVRAAAIVVAMSANVGAFLIGFRVLTAREIPLSDLIPGAVGAGIGVQLLQIGGAAFIGALSGSSQVYGVFGLVLGLLAYLYLQAVIVVFCAEINVVRARRLWPRNLLTLFVQDVALTAADRASYRSYVEAERFKPSQRVRTTFDRPQPEDEP
ncbi:MAG TPA: YihY/virulence factor BrkB family protein [Pseudonocardiaceae bacterium]|nr:YihY/virulence factor BrkB family protein [Pseudonocardiaceae bacterium]